MLKHYYLTYSFVLSVLGVFAQTFPTAEELASEMRIGWNIGNTMEALYENNGTIVAGETAWGNPQITQTLIDGVKAAGFNTIRIPVAWDVHATNSTIDPDWIARVKEVVDYCYNQDLYIILNIHWDNGWLEENCTLASQEEVDAKQASYWNQIATYFKDYDEHLLFASANEPHVDNATEMSVLLSYHQTFVDVVRASGGNNDQRILIVQGPATDIEKTNNLMNTMPTDPSPNRMMAEVHFYPYQFTLMQADESWGNQFYYWGQCNKSTTDQAHNATWGEEEWVDEMFQLMETKFVDNGYPVLLGEYGARYRTNLIGENFELHKRSREYFLKYVTRSALNHGMIPVYWCAGLGELFNRNTGAVLEPGTLNAIMAGAYTNGTTVNCGSNDCQGTQYGHAYTNECNDCTLGYDASCGGAPVLDCHGDENGSAFIDDCGECAAGNTGVTPNSSCEQDCHGDWGGTASLDDCGVCSGGNTGMVANATCCNVDVEDQTICEQGAVEFTINETGDFVWYDAQEGGDVLGEGTTFSATIDANTSFYISRGTSSIETFGRSTQGTEGWGDNEFGVDSKQIKITVSETVTLEAVSVFVLTNPTNVTINVVNTSNGQPAGSGTVNGLTSGKQRIPINAVLQPGEYTINAVGTNNSLHFQTNMASFPYSSSGGSISFENNVSWATSWYGFFYDWEVSTGTSCVRTEVTVSIDSNSGGCEEPDTDGDGTPDASDACPNDPNKAATTGQCGCGNADTDTDSDGTADCNDTFPNDFDNDGVATNDDCDDTNASIGAETVWYEDTDNDGLGDANATTSSCTKPDGYVATAGDACPADPDKTAQGVCGCGIIDADVDGDGIYDCNDDHPFDYDNDGVTTQNDCDDRNINIGAETVWYEDTDGDGVGVASSSVLNCTQPSGYVSSSGDECPDDINKTLPGECGCGATEESCLDCEGTPNGTAELDDCGVCEGTNACLDCAGTPNGDAFFDDCNECVGGETGLEACTQDCHGDFGGTAVEDACGNCAGGNTGVDPVTDPQDCIATSISEYKNQFKLAYPNPTTGELHLSEVFDWQLMDMTGDLLQSGTSDQLSLGGYAPGVYFIKVENQVIKVVKE